MKKVLKTIEKFLIGLLITVVVLVTVIFIYNKIMLLKEANLIDQPLGQLIEVDGHNMCIYTEGDGNHTLVFLSGSGTASPILDFRSLYNLLSDDYRIVVIEKFGYGFSDIVDTERSFDTILRQDREALIKAGIDGSFILCPHSMSGLEAILWAQEYPDEVDAIVGLDMSLPRAYDNFDFDGTLRFEKLAAIGRELGFVRFYYNDNMLPQELTKEEKEIYRAIACRIAVNEAIVNEGIAIPEACVEIDSNPKPDIPMLMFVSDGKETGVKDWRKIQNEYAADLSDVTVIEFDCGHYVHNYEYEQIAEQIRKFTEGLEK